MKITTLEDGTTPALRAGASVRLTSQPDSNGVIHECNGKDLANAHLATPALRAGASVVRALRNAVTPALRAGASVAAEIDFADYTIYHVDLARALLSPLGRQLWPAGHRNAAAYPVADSAGCDCRACQAIREEQGRDPLDTCVPQARYTLAAALAEATQRAEADGRQRTVIQVDPHYVQGGVLRYAVCAADDLPDDADVIAAT
jgi:hypothetical protein